jgi:hypothetical protein
VKFELIDASEAPENLSAMSAEAREKLAMLRALAPGKVAKVPVAAKDMRGFKASLTRLASKHNIAVAVWSDETHAYVRLADPTEANG